MFSVDAGWTDRWWYAVGAAADSARLFAGPYGVEFLTAEDFGVHVNFARPQTVLGDPCNPGDSGSNELIGPDPQDFVQWLQDNPLLATSNLQQVVVAGWRGLSIDVIVGSEMTSICGSPAGTVRKIYLYRTSGGPAHMISDETTRFVVLDVGQSSPFMVWTEASTRNWDRVLPWAQQLLDTLRPYGP